MFVGWDFLLAEIWGLLALAALVGLFAGWLIWGGRRKPALDLHEGEVRRLRAELDRAKAAQRVVSSDPLDDVPPMEGGGYVRPNLSPNQTAPAKKMPASIAPTPDPTPQAIGQKPKGLDAPRNGFADDLTIIKGIGPKMEKLCNSLGFWHYDQIAAWNADEVAWVDDNLEGFKGRVTRDGWVAQAQDLAAAIPPPFVRRKD